MKIPEPIIAFDIHPTRIGYAVVSKHGPIDWGVTRLRRPALQTYKHLSRLTEELCRLWQPAVAVIRNSRRNRGRHIKAIRRALASQGVLLLRAQPARQSRGPSKHEMATALARRFAYLNRLLPRKRRLWDPEEDRMHIFTALRLALLFSPRAGASQSKPKPTLGQAAKSSGWKARQWRRRSSPGSSKVSHTFDNALTREAREQVRAAQGATLGATN